MVKQNHKSKNGGRSPEKIDTKKKWADTTAERHSGSWLRNPRYLAPICAVASILLYWNTHAGQWVYDDFAAVVINNDVRGTKPLTSLFHDDFWGNDIRSPTSHKSYRPLTVLSFRINHWWSGLDAKSFHVGNNILNALAVSASVLVIIGALGVSNKKGTSYALIIACLLYTFHPIHTEAVANTVGRAELLGALLEFISFWCHVRSMKCNKVVSRYFLASLGLAFCAALAKEPCLMVLAICGTNEIATVWLPLTYYKVVSSSDWKQLRQSVVRFLLLAATGLIYILMRLVLSGGTTGMGLKPSFHDNPLQHVTNRTSFVLSALHIQAVYAWKLVYPFNFSCDYGFDAIPMIESLSDPRNLLTLIWAVGLFYLLFKGIQNAREKHDTRLIMALAWIIGPLIPASHLFPLGTVLAERLLYVPSLGYAVLVGIGMENVLSNDTKKKEYLSMVVPLFVAVLAIFSQTIIQRNREWSVNETLWKANYNSHPRNIKSALNRGRTLIADQDYETAYHVARMGYELLPTFVPLVLQYAKSTAFSNAGGHDLDKAHTLLDEGIEMIEARGFYKPEEYEFYSTKAYLFMEENNFDQAKEFYLKSVKAVSQTDPMEPKPYCNLGEIEARRGDWQQGVVYMEKCVTMSRKVTPNDDPHHLDRLGNLGKAYYMTKQWSKAEEIFVETTKYRQDAEIQRLLDELVRWRMKQEEQNATTTKPS